MQFCLVFGVFQIIVLAPRFFFHDSLGKKVETVSGIGFWFTISFFLWMLINQGIGWLGFIGGLVTSVGIAISASSIIKLLG